MAKEKRGFHNNIITISGLLAAATMLVVFAVKGCYPFGGASFAAGDALSQYVPLLEQAKARLFTGELFYSLADGLGYNLFATGAYYFFSPFTLLALLIPVPSAFATFNLALLFKVVGSACTFSYFLTKSFGKKDFSVCAFSLCYAFCGFFSAYAFNIMWLDALVFLPLIALSIERIVEEKSGVLYCVSLAIAIFSSFYTGFMLCIFSVLYFLIRIFGTEGLTSSYNKHLLEEKEQTAADEEFTEYEGKAIIPILFRFGFYSLLAGAMCTAVLYPLYLSLGDAFIKTPEQETLLFSFWDFLSAHLFGTNTAVNYSAFSIPYPFLYSGTIVLLLSPLLLFVKKIRLSERITYSLITLFLIISLLFSDINVLWHGLSVPAGFPFRFAFLYIFLLVVIAYKVFINIRSVRNVLIIISTALAATASIALLFFGNEFYGKQQMVINLVLVILISALLLAYKNLKNKKTLLSAALILIVLIELTANTALTIISDQKRPEVLISQKSAAKTALADMTGPALVRSEVLGAPFPVDFGLKGSYFGINSVSTFHSLSDEILTYSIGGLGNSHNKLNAFNYRKQTPVFNSFFSIGYLYDFEDNEFNNRYYNSLGKYTSKDENAAVDVYKYKYPLPVAFSVNKDITNWIGSFLSDFRSQNVLFESATNIDNLFSIIKAQNHTAKSAVIKSVPEMIKEGSFKGDSFDKYPQQLLDEYMNGLYDVTFENPNEAEITLSYTLDTDNDLYFLYSSNIFDALTVKVNSKEKLFSLPKNVVSYIVPIEGTKKGDTLTFTATLSETTIQRILDETNGTQELNASIWLKLYEMDEKKFMKGYEYLSEGALNITEYKDTYIKGTITAKDNQMIFTSIPYSDGWSAFIDGKETEVICPPDTHLILLDIDEGEHTVELKYTVPGLKLGGTVSAAALLLFVLAVFVEIKLKRKK